MNTNLFLFQYIIGIKIVFQGIISVLFVVLNLYKDQNIDGLKRSNT